MQLNVIDRQTAALEFIDSTYLISIAQMQAMPYKEYLKTAHWQHFKSEALRFYKSECQLCNGKNKQLDVHHKDYKNIGCETFNDVTVLCDDCHNTHHGKQQGQT